MIVFPNCKINIGLQILSKRPDGYHDLETVFYPVPYHDVLEFVPSGSFQFQTSGLSIEADPSSNLCVKAYNLLKQSFPNLPPVTMQLHKQIPMGAGLGGGSADGSYALKALNDHFKLGLSDEALIQLSLQLGSDCPFFIRNHPVIAHGRGELMEPVELDLSTYTLVIINPGIHVSTAAAFKGIVPGEQGAGLADAIKTPVKAWKNSIRNDFETTVFAQYPEVAGIKDLLYHHGAIFASMSGSGSSVYGLFEQAPDLPLKPNWKRIQVPLK